MPGRSPWMHGRSRHPVRRLRLFSRCFRIRSESSEYSSDLEEELSVAVVADGACGFHRSKPCIHDECPNDVTRNVGRLGTVRRLVRLASLEDSSKIDRTSDRG